jgi:hypothetical protein
MNAPFWQQFFPKMGDRPKPGRYHKHYYDAKVGGSVGGGFPRDFEKQFSVRGDHVHVHLVRCGAPLYVRLGQDENPWIRVREGMVLTQPFEKFSVRIGNASYLAPDRSAIFCQAVFLSSYGPLVNYPPKTYGITRTFEAQRGLVAPSGGWSSLWEVWAAASGDTNTHAPTVGKFGGTVLIKNTGLTVPLLVRAGSAFAANTTVSANGWALEAGETLELQLEEPLVYSLADPASGLLVRGDGGSATFQVLISSAEADDVTADQETQHVPVMG